MQTYRPYISILIPDGENELLTNHVKDCFAWVPGIRLYVMSSKKNRPSRYSRFVHHTSYYPLATSELQWIGYINTEMKRFDIDLIMPIFEDCIQLLIKFKDQLKDPSKLVPLSSLRMFTIANNKALLAEHLKKHHIPGPISRQITDINELDLCNGNFPLLVKPIHQTDGGSGIVLLKQKDDLFDFFKTHKDFGNLIFQEFIEGYDIDCSVLCDKGEIKAFTIQRGILYGRKKYAPPIGIRFVYEKEIHKTIEKLMRTLNWSGVAHVDLRYDQNDGKFKVIEVNTRFWGSLDGSLSAGVNFPYLYMLTLLGEKFDDPKYDLMEFYSLIGLLKRISQNFWAIFHLRFLWNNTALKYSLRDPLAFMARICIWIHLHWIKPIYKNGLCTV